MASASQRVPSSISRLTGYIYALYADRVVNVDIPFDPNVGCVERENVPGLVLCVDPTTPPCPGPLKSVKVPLTGTRSDPSRPTTPVPLYEYQTWVKSKAGGPMMGLYDPAGSPYRRNVYPLGDYALVRTELLDSKNGTTEYFPTQWIISGPSGNWGASCNGQKEQLPMDRYDSIRHVIAVHPVEVKIPFALKNIPLPRLPSAAAAEKNIIPGS